MGHLQLLSYNLKDEKYYGGIKLTERIIKYCKNINNPEPAFNNLIKKFNLVSILEHICSISSEIFQTKNNKFKGTINKNLYFINNKHGAMNIEIMIPAWNLVDISYQAVMNCRNYKGRTIKNDNEIYFICAAWNDVSGKYNGELDENGKPEIYDFMTYLFGFFGEQKMFQKIDYITTSINRDYYILNKIAPKIHEYIDDFDINEIIEKQMGVNQIVLQTSLFLLYTIGLNNPRINEIKKIINWNVLISKDDFEKVINYYTISLMDLRNSELKRQVLYSKPIINIDGDLILSNVYLPLFIYRHAILWVARDYYLNKNSQQFINFFGKCFEEYFREIVYEYVEKENIIKLQEPGEHKQADWLLKLDNVNLLIEQKASLMKLSCKQQNLNTKDYKEYIQKTIFKAMRQLKASEDNLDKKCSYYKIILLYEDYIVPEIIDYVFNDPKCDLENDYMYWIVSIEEIEELLYLYKNDKFLFKEIFKEKLQKEEKNSKDGRSIEYLLSQRKARISHITQEKYQEISRLVDKEYNKFIDKNS